MAHPSAARRRLFVHPAHQTVGVSGGGTALRPYCRIADVSADVDAEAMPMRVALVVDEPGPDARLAAARFEQVLQQRRDVQCSRVDLHAGDAAAASRADANCVAIFGRGLILARYWSDLDPMVLVGDGLSSHYSGPMEIELAAAAQGHPLLDGVDSFIACRGLGGNVHVPAGATLLLIGRAAGQVLPAAWVQHGHGRVFRSLLGCADDFRQPAFVRLVLNALAWIGPY